MTKEESFELVFTCDSNPVPVTKDVMEDPNTGGQDKNILENVKENLDTGVRDNKTESSAVIGVHGPRLEDLNIWKKPQETKAIDEGLWKRFKDLMKKKRISSSGSLKSFWKLKNVSTNRKDA